MAAGDFLVHTPDPDVLVGISNFAATLLSPGQFRFSVFVLLFHTGGEEDTIGM